MSTLVSKQKSARALIKKLIDDPKRVFLVHYSCEDFTNRPDGSSARVTSIAVRNMSNGQTHSFSMHLSGDRLKIVGSEFKEHLDILEKDLLAEFNEFTRNYISNTWVHWNMRDSNYGFPAIYHRCKVHGIEPNFIPEENLVGLSRTLIDIYGENYMEHSRLPNLIKMNDISDLSYIYGDEEAVKSEKGEFAEIHRSTLRKVDCFESIINKTHTGRLKTNYRWRDIHAKSPKDFIMFIKDHWLYSVIAMLVLSFAVYRIIKSFFPNEP